MIAIGQIRLRAIFNSLFFLKGKNESCSHGITHSNGLFELGQADTETDCRLKNKRMAQKFF